jgi:hypothetical protein
LHNIDGRAWQVHWAMKPLVLRPEAASISAQSEADSTSSLGRHSKLSERTTHQHRHTFECVVSEESGVHHCNSEGRRRIGEGLDGQGSGGKVQGDQF